MSKLINSNVEMLLIDGKNFYEENCYIYPWDASKFDNKINEDKEFVNFFSNKINIKDGIKFYLEYGIDIEGQKNEKIFDSIFIVRKNDKINIFFMEFKKYNFCKRKFEKNCIIHKKLSQFFSIINWIDTNCFNLHLCLIIQIEDNVEFIFYEFDECSETRYIKKNIEDYKWLSSETIKSEKIDSLLLHLKRNRDLLKNEEEKLFQNLSYKNINNLIDNVNDNSKKLIMIKGGAGTGKTILSKYLFKKFLDQNPLLIFLNKNFHSCYIEKNIDKLKENHLLDKIRSSIRDLSDEKIEETKLFIIDEAQRLGERDLDILRKILISNKKVILIGDDNQKVNKQYDIGLNLIKDLIIKNNFLNKDAIFEWELKENFRFEEDDIRRIMYTFGLSKERPKTTKSNYVLNIFNDSDAFFQKYFSDTDKKFLISTLSNYSVYNINSFAIKRFSKDVAKKNKFFNISSLSDDFMYLNNLYIYNCYHVISKEYFKNYLILPTDFFEKNISNVYHDEIYTLLTRTTHELNVLIENNEYYITCLKNKENIGW